MTRIRVYFEGSPKLRAGFHAFFSELRATANAIPCSISFIAGGGRNDAIHDFRLAAQSHRDAWNILLIDSEEPFREGMATDLCHANRIGPAHAGSVFWMVQVMETWFLADPSALSAYYGDGFKVKHLGAHQNVERIPKADVIAKLKQAAKDTAKGEYHKTAHAPDLLSRIDSSRVRSASINCARLFEAILKALA